MKTAIALALTPLALVLGIAIGMASSRPDPTVQVETARDELARCRVTAAVGVAWAEAWQEVAVVATDARLGYTGHTIAGSR